MRRLVTVLLVLLASVTLPMVATPGWATGGPDPSFARTYGGGAGFSATAVRQTTDGGFIVAGIASSFSGSAQIWLLRLDGTGGVVWQRMYGSTFVGSLGFVFSRPEVVEVSDGGFVVDSTMNVSSITVAARVFKVDKDGVLGWQERFAGTGNATATSIDTTADEGVVVAGTTGPGVLTPGLGTTALVLKMNSITGGLIWEKTYSGLGASMATSIRQTSDGGFVVAGATSSMLLGSQAWVLRLNSDGGVRWQEAFPGGELLLFSAQQTSDGGFIAAGLAIVGSTLNVLVLRLDNAGVPVWQKTYSAAGQTALVFSVEQTSDGGFIVAGDLISSAPPSAVSALVLRLDSAGSIEWQKAFGGAVSQPALATSAAQTSDGGFVVAGIEFSTVPVSPVEALVFKLNSHGAIHPCKDLSETDLVASTLSTMPTSITGSGVDITSSSPAMATAFTSTDTSGNTTVLCHHGFKP